MTPPHVRLGAWVTAQGWSQERTGETLGVSQPLVSDILLGKKLPGRRTANRIEAETADLPEGPIRATDWDDWESMRSGTGTNG